MTSAATFFPAKLTVPASSDLKVEVNVIAADSATTVASARVSVVNTVCTGVSSHHEPHVPSWRIHSPCYAAADGASVDAVSAL